jgi:MFS superfamily sulfate permease-like transporter
MIPANSISVTIVLVYFKVGRLAKSYWQGIGNVACGLVGGLPVTSVVVRGSVNGNASGKTRRATLIHGTVLLVSVPFISAWLNTIPLSALAAILLMIGIKLASPTLIKQMWNKGGYQFIPFAVTVMAIVFIDLLIGIVSGLAVAIGFILNSNMRWSVHSVHSVLEYAVLMLNAPKTVHLLPIVDESGTFFRVVAPLVHH